MDLSVALHIDRGQCRALGQVAIRLPLRRERLMPPLPAAAGEETEALHWIIATAICQQTRTLDGVIGGKRLRGSDYLLAALRQHLVDHPGRWTPGALLAWTEEELRSAVSDGGDPATSTLDRLEERLRLLRGVARHLLDAHRGSAMALWRDSDRTVADLLARLAPMEAFADPVAKKSHLLLSFLHERGLWPLVDPQNLETAIDYHVMRVALRLGLVEVKTPELRRLLVDQVPVSGEVDSTLRLAVRRACREVVGTTPGLTPFRLDHLLWMVGRNCCFYEHPPVCTAPGRCWKMNICSLLESIPHDCGLSCPLSCMCRGAADEGHRTLRETAFDTHYY